jgi:glycosyltransferase involved in cell wall biosynthesis
MPHLVVFSHLRWNFVFRRPQHLLSRLARHYHVVFVEEPVHAAKAHLEHTRPLPNVDVLRPHTPVAAAGFHDDQLPMLKALLAAHFAEHAIDDYIVWFYTPMALPLLSELAPRAVVYDCMDELSALKDAPRQMRQREMALLKRAQLVMTGGPSLYESKRPLHPNVLCLPSAVDAAHYAQPDDATVPTESSARAAALQDAIPGPRLGFFGEIDERLDVDLVAALADADPAWHIVMVGPVVKIDPARLPQRPNVHWLGRQPYEVLPRLVAGWDACLVPFALNEATRYISPTKTLEYLAAGKPVVSTGIHDIRAMFSDVVRIADGPAAFVAACRATLRETALHRAERFSAMQACVWRYSWDETAAVVHRAIQAVLAGTASPLATRRVAGTPLPAAA